jgi:phosphonate transport system substrate-binding protein
MLKFTSIQAGNADPTCAAITAHISAQLHTPIEFTALPQWQDRERAFDSKEVAVCWMCGAVYVRKLDHHEGDVELLAAPVMIAPRYQDRPVYFSDVIVRVDSPFQTFGDLRGARWAYNEPNSHSGYKVTLWYLASHGYGTGFFGQVHGSGAHQNSIQMVLSGEIDASAIDSTVLETELNRQPDLASRLRIIESFGPSPIPPWVMYAGLPADVKATLRQAFSQMHLNDEGRAILEAGQIRRFDLVTDRDYDRIREMAQLAQTVNI